MIGELLKAFFLIFIAEMGDKTQILAMTFATRYSISQVLTGVFLGSLFNHGIAILLGTLLSNVIPLDTIQLIAGISFVGFGFWSLKLDEEDESEEKSSNSFGPILTVGLAFFIGELGDKTQLTAMTIATDSMYPIFVLMGTVLGMIGTSSLGIFVGSKVGDKIPELGIKIGSSIVFIFFGTIKVYQNVPVKYLSPLYIGLFVVLVILPFVYMIRKNLESRKTGNFSPLKEAAATLYNYTHKINEAVEEICLSEGHCGRCKGSTCLIGFTKNVLNYANENEEYVLPLNLSEIPKKGDKEFDENKVIYGLALAIVSLNEYNPNNKSYVVIKVKDALEIILFSHKIEYESEEKYLNKVKNIDYKIYNKLKITIDKIKSENI